IARCSRPLRDGALLPEKLPDAAPSEVKTLRLRAVRPSAKHAVTIHTGVVELIGGIADRLLTPGLRRLVGGVARIRQFHTELDPIRIGYGNELAVFATPAGSQHQLRRLRNRHGSVVDDVPSSVNNSAPRQPI